MIIKITKTEKSPRIKRNTMKIQKIFWDKDKISMFDNEHSLKTMWSFRKILLEMQAASPSNKKNNRTLLKTWPRLVNTKFRNTKLEIFRSYSTLFASSRLFVHCQWTKAEYWKGKNAEG